MADGKIKISELDEALQLSDNAEFPYTQDNGGVPTTFKAPANQIARKVAEGSTFTNLTTTAKTLVGAINELKALGSPILLGTTSPTAQQGADGNIYVQYTEGTGGDPDTVDSIYAKIDGAWCEIETGGGGGSGGHTIVDDSGTALTQRTNLQFNGAYSEDNSTDDTTEVNVVREMSQAEFDQLTEAEKQGLIRITDGTLNIFDKFQPVIYSEDEREIGVWIDGKPLYQKTIVLQNVTVSTSSGYTYDITSLNVDAPIETPQGFIVLSSGTDKRALPFNLLGNYGMTIAVSRTSVVLSRASADITCDYVIFTIRYTKTTDTAGSGQWTPQGVPAVHYSEDEHIVGTWIDGSTIYEKTVPFTTPSSNAYTTVSFGVANASKAWAVLDATFVIMGTQTANVGSYVSSPQNDQFVGLVTIDSNGLHFDFRVGLNYQGNKQGYATIRYTKSST